VTREGIPGVAFMSYSLQPSGGSHDVTKREEKITAGGEAARLRRRTLREQVAEELEEGGAEEGGAGNGEHPGEHDAASNAPADGGKAARCADTHDGAGDGVRGADGDAEMRG